MNLASWNEFWSMGGYGFFVWGAYALGVVGIAAEVSAVRARFGRALRAVRRSVYGRALS